jgi:hypothetical protein
LSTAILKVYNGSDFDAVRNNIQGTLLESEERAASVESDDQINYNGRGVHVILDVTAIDATPSIVLTIQGKDAAGNYYTILEGAAVIAVSRNVYRAAPWCQNVANVSVADFLPREWRVIVTHGDADKITYGVYFNTDC